MDSVGWMDVVFGVVALLVLGAVIAIVSDRAYLLGDADSPNDQQVPNAKM